MKLKDFLLEYGEAAEEIRQENERIEQMHRNMTIKRR